MKRFTDTERWRDPWFRRLPPELKLAWDYIWSNCDNSGVWVVDWELFEYMSGSSVVPDEIMVAFGNRVKLIGDGKLWIVGFIRFQFGELSKESRVHQSIFLLLRSHGIDSLSIEYPESIHTPKDKDIDKDSTKDKDSEGESEGKLDHYHKDARAALHILNEASGAHFREVDSNLTVISARLREPDVDLPGVRKMIERQCKRWKGTTQAEYLRPETLFGKTKFDSYYAARELPVSDPNGQAGKPRFDRNAGTANEGRAHLYKGVAQSIGVPKTEPVPAPNNGTPTGV